MNADASFLPGTGWVQLALTDEERQQRDDQQAELNRQGLEQARIALQQARQQKEAS